MRLLILGGTAFLGRAAARAALAAGHEVTCAARGRSGEPADGVTFVAVDRDGPDGLAPLRGLEFDALVDVSSRPGQVRRAVAELAPRVGHAVYVSSGSAYADTGTPGQRATEAPLLAPASPSDDDPTAPETYGPRKVACERAVLDGFGADRTFVCRAGLIIGPEDDTGRFTYWVDRLARGGEVLAPGAPDDLVQYVDVRDLADWLVRAAETRLAGVYDGTGAPVSREHFLTHVAVGVATPVQLTWVDQEFLRSEGVAPWMGPRSLPLWLPLPEYAGFLSRDVSAALEAGLRTRDVTDTARHTLAWRRTTPESSLTGAGISPEDEAALLEKWHGTMS
ncbi:NAD-dependent epimerase/dehydratase family protein [Planosporangium sp. 12N6]|uniref:NAD-dependent epimerase/dehydratase family protein n=1 Tax=Planosporangium spinosum TaxID=3402278 RepID=UPI003CF7B015